MDSPETTPDVPMTSNMVAAPASRFSRPGYDSTQSALAQQLSTQGRFQLPQWAPRTGRTPAFAAWIKVLQRIAGLLGVDLDRLDEEQPASSSQPATRSLPSKSSPADAARGWLVYNTILYDVVQPSLILRGVDGERDVRKVDGLAAGGHADGRKLVAWALKFADVSGLQKQTKIRAALAAAKLRVDATRAQISSFMQRLHALWLLDTTTRPDQPHSYWSMVLIAMPTAPHGSHSVTLRTWLAQHVAAYEKAPQQPTFLTDIDTALDEVLEYAELIGVPAGSVETGADTLAYIDLSLTGDDGGDDEALNAMGSTRPGGAGNQRGGQQRIGTGNQQRRSSNECDFCDSYACQGRKRSGGFVVCACHKDSKMALDKVSKGNARFIKMARAWHAANPSATSLKGVRFSLKPPTDAKSGAERAPKESMQAIGVPKPAPATMSILELLGERADATTQREVDDWLRSVDPAGGEACILALGSSEPPPQLEVVAENAPLEEQVGHQETAEQSTANELQEMRAQLQAAQEASQGLADSHAKALALERAAADEMQRRLDEATHRLDATSQAIDAARRYGTPLSALAIDRPPPSTKAFPATVERDRERTDDLQPVSLFGTTSAPRPEAA
jgi:hypothetical protein